VDDLEARLEKAAENFEVERKGWRDRDDEKEQERVRETARLTRESSDAQRMQEELQALVADLRQETADLQQRLQETADLQQRLQDARTDRDEALARVGAVKGELAHSEEMHRARTESLNEELASTKTEAHLLRQERDEAVSRDQAIRSEMAAIKEELALVRTTMAATQQAEEERRRMLRETETELESNKELLKVSEMRVATLEAAKVRVSRHEQLVAEEEMRLRDEIARLKSVDVQVLHQSDCVL
jgi:chromosome segregation ATPase